MERGRIGHSGKAQDPVRFVFGRGGWLLSRWLHHGGLRWPSRMALCTRCASIPPTARSWNSARQRGRNAPFRHRLHKNQSAGSIVEYRRCQFLPITWIRSGGARQHGKTHATIGTALSCAPLEMPAPWSPPRGLPPAQPCSQWDACQSFTGILQINYWSVHFEVEHSALIEGGECPKNAPPNFYHWEETP